MGNETSYPSRPENPEKPINYPPKEQYYEAKHKDQSNNKDTDLKFNDQSNINKWINFN